jgi:hypothetical protein
MISHRRVRNYLHGLRQRRAKALCDRSINPGGLVHLALGSIVPTPTRSAAGKAGVSHRRVFYYLHGLRQRRLRLCDRSIFPGGLVHLALGREPAHGAGGFAGLSYNYILKAALGHVVHAVFIPPVPDALARPGLLKHNLFPGVSKRKHQQNLHLFRD